MIIETVGVGQDEVDIIRTADLSLVTLVPGTGDDAGAQGGIMEIADIFVVNKADRDGADRLVSAVEGNLRCIHTERTTGGRRSSRPSRPRAPACRKSWRSSARFARTPRGRRASAGDRAASTVCASCCRSASSVISSGRSSRPASWPEWWTASRIAKSIPTRLRINSSSARWPTGPALESRGVRRPQCVVRMKAVLDHIGTPSPTCRRRSFYRDALGLRSRRRSGDTARPRALSAGWRGDAELLATAPDSPIAKYLETGPGAPPHHAARREHRRRARAVEGERHASHRRTGAPRRGRCAGRVHPPFGAHGVLVELKQSARHPAPPHRTSHPAPRTPHISRFTLGDLELISLYDGFFGLDGGSMFGIVPKALWAAKAPPDDRNRIALAMRPLIVRGVRTMIIDAGMGDKENDKFHEIYAVNRARHLDHALAEAGLAPEDIDIVLATHLHFDHAGGFTVRDASGRLRPRFPRPVCRAPRRMGGRDAPGTRGTAGAISPTTSSCSRTPASSNS